MIDGTFIRDTCMTFYASSLIKLSMKRRNHYSTDFNDTWANGTIANSYRFHQQIDSYVTINYDLIFASDVKRRSDRIRLFYIKVTRRNWKNIFKFWLNNTEITKHFSPELFSLRRAPISGWARAARFLSINNYFFLSRFEHALASIERQEMKCRHTPFWCQWS